MRSRTGEASSSARMVSVRQPHRPTMTSLPAVAPLGEKRERAQNAGHVFARLDGRHEEHIVLRQRGIGLGFVGDRGKVGIEPLVDGVDSTPIDVEVLHEITRRRRRNRDDPVSAVKCPRQDAISDEPGFPAPPSRASTRRPGRAR